MPEQDPKISVLKRTWNEVRGNAKWDLAKYVAPGLWGSLAVAATLVLGWLREQPPGFFVMCGMFGFAALLAVVVYGKHGIGSRAGKAAVALFVASPILFMISRTDFGESKKKLAEAGKVEKSPSPAVQQESANQKPEIAKKAVPRIKPNASRLNSKSKAAETGPKEKATQEPSGGIRVTIAPGGVGSVNQSGGITAGHVVITPPLFVNVRIEMLSSNKPDHMYGISVFATTYKVELSGQVPRFDVIASGSELMEVEMLPAAPGTSHRNKGQTNDGSRYCSVSSAFGTYFAIVKAKTIQDVQLHFQCEGVACVEK